MPNWDDDQQRCARTDDSGRAPTTAYAIVVLTNR
jgi:hypothetical protein